MRRGWMTLGIGLLAAALLCGPALAEVTKSLSNKSAAGTKTGSLHKAQETAAPHVLIKTQYGEIEIELLPEVAPKTVENFLSLVKKKFYDGTTFHRVITGFMIQGGCPNSKDADARTSHGTGGPGYQIKAEFNATKHARGVVSMARSNHPDSAGSQFFIVVKQASHLDGKYTAFGKVVRGMEVVDKIVSLQRDGNDNPLSRVEMQIRVLEAKKEAADSKKEQISLKSGATSKPKARSISK